MSVHGPKFENDARRSRMSLALTEMRPFVLPWPPGEKLQAALAAEKSSREFGEALRRIYEAHLNRKR